MKVQLRCFSTRRGLAIRYQQPHTHSGGLLVKTFSRTLSEGEAYQRTTFGQFSGGVGKFRLCKGEALN